MLRALPKLILVTALLIAMSSLYGPTRARAQQADDLKILKEQAERLFRQGRYTEAIATDEKALALAERELGKEHPDTLISANDLAVLYHQQGRYSDAERLYRRALAGEGRVFGNDHPATLNCSANLASLYMAQGRHAEAEPLLKRVLDVQERVLGKDNPMTLNSANTLAKLYQEQSRHAEAEALFKRALAAQIRVLGVEDPRTLISLSNLTWLYHDQGRYAEAEPLMKRALDSQERLLGRDHPDTIATLGNLASLFQAQGRYADAEPLYQRSLDVEQRIFGKEHPRTLTSMSELARLYKAEGRYEKAEPLLSSAVETSGRVLGPEHSYTLIMLGQLAQLYQAEGRYSEAETIFKRVLEVEERTLGKDQGSMLTTLNNLAALYRDVDRDREAEILFKRVIEARERVFGRENPRTLTSLNNLAELYYSQGRYEAEPLYNRVVEARVRLYGKDHPDTLTSLSNLAQLYHALGRFPEAERLFKGVLAAQEVKLGPDHPSTLLSVNNLGSLYRTQNRYAEAEPLFKRAEARERVYGKDHPSTLLGVNNLAELFCAEGRYAEAELLFKRVLDDAGRVLGKEHPYVGIMLSNLAISAFAQKDWGRASELWRRRIGMIEKRMQLGARDAAEAVAANRKSDAELSMFDYWGLVAATYRLTPEGRSADAAREMFQVAQWAQGSETAQSLTQMAARSARGDAKLAVAVRERQDAVGEWRTRDARRNAALSLPPTQRDAAAETDNLTRLVAIETRIAQLDKRLATEFPDYAALASPAPLSVEEVQAELGPGEALVLFLDIDERLKPLPEESFIWVVTRTDVRWARIAMGKAALAREVQALRCGLDAAAWAGPRCADLTGGTATGKELPFNHARAYKLYTALFGPVADLIKDKHLLLVPSGPLTLLPFQVLVTAPPADASNRSAAWLVRDHALTVLPAVSSLKALRRVGRPSTAGKPMIGFGNPLLAGPDDSYAEYAQLARDKQRCGETVLQRVAAFAGFRDGIAPMETRGGLADISLIRKQLPLPETADELCAVAHDLHADVREMRLGGRATEHEVKALSESGQLAQYRVVHFATHGAMAGEMKGRSEPGLILTPPDVASDDDDGYLTASEIAGLKLDADWVILSACNTAAGNAANAEALSGLARAFIYAQARALLVSHWAVTSNATVTLITSAMREIARDKAVGRAEALRRAMLVLIDHGSPAEAHPAFWAPFIVVGEGAR